MSTLHTITRRVLAVDLPALQSELAAYVTKLAKRKITANLTLEAGEPYAVKESGTLERNYVSVTLTYQTPVLPGGWQMIAFADFSSEIPLVYSTAEGVNASNVSRMCDHCKTDRMRHKVFVIENSTGQRMQVGSTCVADYLGHNVASLMAVPEVIQAVEEDGGFWGSRSTSCRTLDFVLAAAVTVRLLGWRPASYENGLTTKELAKTLVFADGYEIRRTFEEDAERATALLRDPDVLQEADAAMAWAGTMIPRSDFDYNLQSVARAEEIGPKGMAMGVAAYLPVAHQKHLGQLAEKAVQVKNEAVSVKNAKQCPRGRRQITGKVTKLAWRDSRFGLILKLTILEEQGFKVSVTAPRAIAENVAPGDAVSMKVTLEPSGSDAYFGFGQRPASATLLAA